MADVYARVKEIERRLNFIMTTLWMRAMIAAPGGIVGPDGKPAGQPFDGTLLELYQLARVMPREVVSPPEEPTHDAA